MVARSCEFESHPAHKKQKSDICICICHFFFVILHAKLFLKKIITQWNKIMRLVFASNNAHKLDEVRAIMLKGIEILSLSEIGFESEIEETGLTLAENSKLKAEAVESWLIKHGKWNAVDGVFADDTGLEIDALGGEPGVYTGRWAERETGIHLPEAETYAANRRKALRELAGKENRGCQFKTVITLITNNNAVVQVEGIVRGKITSEEHGVGGFGYDPIFIPEGYDATFGELPAQIKNTISHRARALAKLVDVVSLAIRNK